MWDAGKALPHLKALVCCVFILTSGAPCVPGYYVPLVSHGYDQIHYVMCMPLVFCVISQNRTNGGVHVTDVILLMLVG